MYLLIMSSYFIFNENVFFSFYRWLGFRLELIGNLITFAAAVFSVAERNILNGGQVGLSLTYALQVNIDIHSIFISQILQILY